MIRYRMKELAAPTMKRKDPLIAAPAVLLSTIGLSSAHSKAEHTNDAPHATKAIQFVVDVRANGNGNVLKHSISRVSIAYWGF